MPRIIKPLSDREIKTAKTKDKDYKLYDGNGLHVLIKSNGSKLFRLEFKYNSKKSTISFGKYPQTTLAEARLKRDEANKKINDGIDPRTASKKSEALLTLNDVIDIWLKLTKDSWSEVTYKKNKIIFDKNIRPYSGTLPIDKIESTDIINDIERIQERGADETANRLLPQLSRVFKYAVTKKMTKHNIIADIDNASILKKSRNKHFPALTKKDDVSKLMKNIMNYRNDYAIDLGVAIALEISPFLALRPYNIRALEKKEINFEEKYIYIEAEKMKTNEDFILPIGDFVIEKLKEAMQIEYRDSNYVFPSPLNKNKPLSDNTLNSALKRMGYKGLHTVHGFRSTFSTNAYDMMNEHKFNEDIIEACLSHTEQNKIKAAYNRSYVFKYLDEKRKLFTWYENWLMSLI